MILRINTKLQMRSYHGHVQECAITMPPDRVGIAPGCIWSETPQTLRDKVER